MSIIACMLPRRAELTAILPILFWLIVSWGAPLRAEPDSVGASATPVFDAVAITTDGSPFATGLVVGFTITDSEAGRVTKRLVLAPLSAIRPYSPDQIGVKDASGRIASAMPLQIEFQRLAEDEGEIARLARANQISVTLARERLKEAGSQPPIVILSVLQTGEEIAPARQLEVLDETCPDEGERRFYIAEGNGLNELSESQFGIETPNPLGAVAVSECQGRRYVRGFVNSVRGRQVETVDLSSIANALKMWTTANEAEADLTLRLVTPRFVEQCPSRSLNRGSARVAQTLLNEQTGDLVLRVVDLPPVVDQPVSIVSERSEQRLFEGEYSWGWGSRGGSNEFFVLRVSGGEDGQFVFDRYCKENLAPRGRVVGQIDLVQGASLSQDAGAEAGNARFAIRISDRLTIVSSPTLRHGLIVDSFPEGGQVNRAGRLYFAESASGGDLLIGHSRSGGVLYVAKLPNGDEGEGGDRETTGSLPALRVTEPRPLRWRDNAFDLKQLNWQGERQTDRSSTGSQERGGEDSTALQIDVAGRSIAIAGDGGLAVLQLDGADRPRLMVNIDRAEPAIVDGTEVTPLRRRFAQGNFKLVASTVAQAPGSEDFAVAGLYSERVARSGQDLLAILPVVAGVAQPLVLLDPGAAVRDRIEAAGQTLPLGDDRLYELRPSSGRLVLGTTPSLERFWGALIVNAMGQAGQAGRQSRDFDFALAFNMHLWFNRFDRIWEFEPVGTVADAQSLCERFDFGRLNVIRVDNVPRRVIAPVAPDCVGAEYLGAPDAYSFPNTKILAIRDFLFDRIRTNGAQ